MKNKNEEVLNQILAACPRLTSKNFNSYFLIAMEQMGYKFAPLEPLAPSNFSLLKNTSELYEKGKGAIFVENVEDVKRVCDIIKALDEYEYDFYFNEKMVIVFDEKYSTSIQLDYVGKYDMAVDKILNACADAGIEVKIISEPLMYDE